MNWICFSPLLFLCGCERVHQHMKSMVWDYRAGTIEMKETCATAFLTGDTQAKMDKFRLSNGKTQSIGVTGAEGSSSLENVKDITHDLTELGARIGLKMLVPGL